MGILPIVISFPLQIIPLTPPAGVAQEDGEQVAVKVNIFSTSVLTRFFPVKVT